MIPSAQKVEISSLLGGEALKNIRSNLKILILVVCTSENERKMIGIIESSPQIIVVI